MTQRPEYGKVIMFDFEQNIRQELEDETSSSSKKAGNLYSNVRWINKGECFSIGEGMSSESFVESEITNDRDAEHLMTDYKKYIFKSKL
jgi:hypothetical protein